MDLLVQFAQKVVKAVSKISPFAISLSDEKGCIIGATNPERVGTYHMPSKEVIEKNDFVVFDKIKIENMDNVFEGIAFPLQFDYKTVGVLGIIGPPAQVEPYGLLIKNYVEMMWQETIHRQITDMETKTMETFAQYILLNEEVRHQRVEQYCDMVGISYGKKNFCIVIDIGNSLLNSAKKHISVDQLKENLIRCTKEAYGCFDHSLCTFLNTEKIVIVRQVNHVEEYKKLLQQFDKQSRTLIKLLDVYDIKNPSIAAGSLSNSIENVNESYHEAENLIRFAKEKMIEPTILTNYNWEILLEKLPIQISEDYYQTILFRLSSFIEHERFTEMAELFITYCENNMNISQAAKALYIHRNTLIYRLKKIEELTSLNTSSFQDCTLLYLVLKHH
ncbi:sugar diacid recognition domain-containing protein [Virgibacillus kimchii]